MLAALFHIAEWRIIMTQTKRTDNKGRILKTGESQRKDGRYQFQYTDSAGKRHCVYDMKLADLREKERKLFKDLEDGIRSSDSQKITLNDLFEMYLENHRGIREATAVSYREIFNVHIKDSFIGKKPICSIKNSDMLKFYNGLLDKGLSTGYLQIMHAFLNPAFEMAVDDDLIRKNPCRGIMAKLSKTEKLPKRAMTLEEQRSFLNFLSGSKRFQTYFPLFTILLGTGMRIGECLGLTWNEVDFKNRLIHVTHTLRYDNYGDGNKFHISEPKTESGKRTIPMIEDVRAAFLTVRKNNLALGGSGDFTVDGYKDFVFLTVKKRRLYMPNTIVQMLARIVKVYNEEETQAAAAEKREPLLLPHLTPHTMRHTFCTRFCENETNVRVIQEVMGHKDIKVTMNIYSHVTIDKARECMESMEQKMKVF